MLNTVWLLFPLPITVDILRLRKTARYTRRTYTQTHLHEWGADPPPHAAAPYHEKDWGVPCGFFCCSSTSSSQYLKMRLCVCRHLQMCFHHVIPSCPEQDQNAALQTDNKEVDLIQTLCCDYKHSEPFSTSTRVFVLVPPPKARDATLVLALP